MTNPDGEVAARAKEDFTQCCAWLRHFSSMWPAASAHKLFFEAGEWSIPHRIDSGQYELMHCSSRSGRLEVGGSRSRQRRLCIAFATHGLIAFSLAHRRSTSCSSPFIGIEPIEFGLAYACHEFGIGRSWGYVADTALLLEPSLYRHDEWWQH